MYGYLPITEFSEFVAVTYWLEVLAMSTLGEAGGSDGDDNSSRVPVNGTVGLDSTASTEKNI